MIKRIAGCSALLAIRCRPRRARPTRSSLMLNWYVYSEHAPFFLGKEKGFFASEGIDLDIQEGRGSGVTVQAVAAKTAQFGYVDVPTMMRAAVKGAPVIAVGVALQTSPMSAMGFAEKNISKPEDIKGKTVAITPGDSMSQIWPLFLKKTGLKESEFKTVSGDAQTKLNAVINGQADLLLGYVMDQSMRIKDATGKRCLPDQLRRLRRQPGQLRHHRQQGYAEGQARPRQALHASPARKRSRRRRRTRGPPSKRCSRPTRRAARSRR